MSKRQGGPMGGGPHGGMGAGEKAKDFKGTIKKLMKYREKRQQRFLQDLWEKYPEAPELILKKSHIF